jgi:hypothetical protein
MAADTGSSSICSLVQPGYVPPPADCSLLMARMVPALGLPHPQPGRPIVKTDKLHLALTNILSNWRKSCFIASPGAATGLRPAD